MIASSYRHLWGAAPKGQHFILLLLAPNALRLHCTALSQSIWSNCLFDHRTTLLVPSFLWLAAFPRLLHSIRLTTVIDTSWYNWWSSPSTLQVSERVSDLLSPVLGWQIGETRQGDFGFLRDGEAKVPFSLFLIRSVLSAFCFTYVRSSITTIWH